MAREFTDSETKAMLKAIHERQGKWGDRGADAEIVNIGKNLGLSEDKSLEMFKHLVDRDYSDPGRVLQADDATNPEQVDRAVGVSVSSFSAASKRGVKELLRYARDLGLSATLRPSRGQDIDAACGQLAAKDLRGRRRPAVVPLG